MPPQDAHALGHVAVNTEPGEARQDMPGRLIGRPVQAGPGQHYPQRAFGQLRERLIAAGGRQREPVAQHHGEP